MAYNTDLQSNNVELQEILDTINTLPEPKPDLETCTVEISCNFSIKYIIYTTVNNAGEVIYAHIAPNSTETQTITALCNSVVTVIHAAAMWTTEMTGCERITQHTTSEFFGLTALAGETASIKIYGGGGGSN